MPYTDARMAEVERLLRYQNPRTGRSPSRETCPAGDVQSVELLRQEYEEGLALMAEFLGAKDTAMALLKEQCDSEVERKHILAGLKERGMLNALKKKMTEYAFPLLAGCDSKKKARPAINLGKFPFFYA